MTTEAWVGSSGLAGDPYFTQVAGTFYRAVDPRYREHALAGSVAPGRYSRQGESTLYLSSSREGVAAAMVAHTDARSPALEVLRFHVQADGIVDLRDEAALASLGVNKADAIAPWQQVVADGGSPPSWGVRGALVDAGADGLIDPSRTAPGLWHLVLFRWNEPGAPRVTRLD